jgi:hypothetical protein
MLGYLRRIASKVFARPPLVPEVVAWYGIQASAGKNPIGWVDPSPYIDREQLYLEGLIPLEGQQLSELKQYPELVALLQSHGESQLPDRRILI